jgi:hypothetical protein
VTASATQDATTHAMGVARVAPFFRVFTILDPEREHPQRVHRERAFGSFDLLP